MVVELGAGDAIEPASDAPRVGGVGASARVADQARPARARTRRRAMCARQKLSLVSLTTVFARRRGRGGRGGGCARACGRSERGRCRLAADAEPVGHGRCAYRRRDRRATTVRRGRAGGRRVATMVSATIVEGGDGDGVAPRMATLPIAQSPHALAAAAIPPGAVPMTAPMAEDDILMSDETRGARRGRGRGRGARRSRARRRRAA